MIRHMPIEHDEPEKEPNPLDEDWQLAYWMSATVWQGNHLLRRLRNRPEDNVVEEVPSTKGIPAEVFYMIWENLIGKRFVSPERTTSRTQPGAPRLCQRALHAASTQQPSSASAQQLGFAQDSIQYSVLCYTCRPILCECTCSTSTLPVAMCCTSPPHLWMMGM